MGGRIFGASDSAYGSESDLPANNPPSQSQARCEAGGREGKQEGVGGAAGDEGDFMLDVSEEEKVMEENSRLRRNWIE